MMYLSADSSTMTDEPNTLNLWIVADNLSKGAATNAVQIASWMVKHHLVGKQTA